MNTIDKKVPSLRFPEFTEEWEEKKLGEVAERVTTKNKDKNILTVLSNSAVKGIIKQDDFFDFEVANDINKDRYYIVEKDNFVYNPRISVSAPVGPMKRSHIKELGIISPLYTVLKFKTGFFDYFEMFFSSNYWHIYMRKVANFGARFDRMNITNEDLMNLPLPFPSLPEQEKIANFLSVVDTRLQTLKDKKEKLETYKRGAMQQIFSQELRFTCPDGSAYPDWKKKKLGDVAKLQGGFAFKSESFQRKGIPIIRISNISPENRIDTEKLVFYSKLDNDENYLLTKGDLIIALSGATTGKSCVYNLALDSYLNQRVGVFRSKLDNLYYGYLIQYVFSVFFQQSLSKVLVAGAQPNISPSDIELFNIEFPSLDEQKQIADFLSAIDQKIAFVGQQIDSTEQYKKGLLQQMFV